MENYQFNLAAVCLLVLIAVHFVIASAQSGLFYGIVQTGIVILVAFLGKKSEFLKVKK